jgi:hypothetical protein
VHISGTGDRLIATDLHEYARRAVALWFKRLAMGALRYHPPEVVTTREQWLRLHGANARRRCKAWKWAMVLTNVPVGGMCCHDCHRIFVDVEVCRTKRQIYSASCHEVLHLVYRQAREEWQVAELEDYWMKRMDRVREAKATQSQEETTNEDVEIVVDPLHEYARRAVDIWFRRLAIGDQRKHPPEVITEWEKWRELHTTGCEAQSADDFYASGMCCSACRRIFVDVRMCGEKWIIRHTALHEVLHLVYGEAITEDQIEALKERWLERIAEARAKKEAESQEETTS